MKNIPVNSLCSRRKTFTLHGQEQQDEWIQAEMNSADRQANIKNPVTDGKGLEAARKVIASLLLARKNCSLYPQDHPISGNSLNQFFALLRTYVQTYGDLKIEVEKDRLVSEGEVIHADTSEEGTLSFTLFRDGIRWLKFLDGIAFEEAKQLLEIINRYSMLTDEAQGDIATDFWENNFAHIRYEAIDPFETHERNTDTAASLRDRKDQDAARMRDERLADEEPLPHPQIDQAALSLSPEEEMILREMVRLEEAGNPTAYLDALFDSLLEYEEQENFEVILGVLEEEFAQSIARRDLDSVVKILQGMQCVLDTGKAELPWTLVILIQRFFQTLSSATSLNPLREIWPHLEADQVDKAGEFFKLLQPEALHSLCTILTQNQSTPKRQVLEGAIVDLASRDVRPLESMLKNPDTMLLEKLIPVVVRLERDQLVKSLFELVHHPSNHVRREAIRGILKKGADTREIFSLIHDQDDSIRHLILNHIGRSRDRVAEKLLLAYMEQRKFTSRDDEHVIACFTALGRCGSSHCLPYLQQTLLHRGWMPAFWMNAHRKGAAVALKRLGLKEARDILEKAGRSL
jgi:hypothetical protein